MNNAHVDSVNMFNLSNKMMMVEHQNQYLFEKNLPMKILVICDFFLVYIISAIIFYSYLHQGVAALSIIPVGLIGWMYGKKGGLAASSGLLILNPMIFSYFLGQNWSMNLISTLLGSTLIIYVGVLVGHLSELNHTVKFQLDNNNKIESHVRKSENRLKAVFSSLPAGIVLIDKKTHQIKDVNQQGSRMIGRKKEDIIGRRCGDYFKSTWPGNHMIDDLKDTGLDIEYTIKRPDGNELPVLKNTGPLTLEDQEYILVSFIDISDRKMMERKLEAEKEMTKKYLNSAGVMILILNNAGNIIFINQKGCQILEYNEDEVVGKNLFTELNPQDNMTDSKAVFEELTSGFSDIFEYMETKFITKSNKEKIIAWHHSVLRNDEGEVTHIISSGEDISTRKYTEKALKASEDKYRSIFETAANLIISADRDGTILDCNNKVEPILGYSKTELIGKNISQILHSDNISIAKQSMHDVFTNGYSPNKECRMVKKDGTTIDVNVSSSAIKNDDGEYSRTICLIEDITEKKKARNNLIEKTKELERFSKLAIGRENRMIELKERVKYLEKQVTGLIEISLGE